MSKKSQPPAHYEGVPGARNSTAVTTWQEFEGGLREREKEIASMLPTHVGIARFQACAIAAVKQNPDLLRTTARSLFGAVTKAAQDGLLPDGREGVITAYGQEAKWNPMAYGLRKRAKEVDGILIDAQVVGANDRFIWHQGDKPGIEHDPAPLGEPRGTLIGAYAIFKREDGTILHREVMSAEQIEAVHEQSKAQQSLMWTKFKEEAWRKTVLRRGIKSVPVSEQLESIVRRDDEMFDFSSTPAIEAQPEVMTPPRPRQSEFERPREEPKPKAEVKPTSQPEGPTEPDGRPEPPPVGEEVRTEPVAVQAEMQEPEVEETPINPRWAEAQETLAKLEQNIREVGDAEMADYKASGRRIIDGFEGLSDEERDALRGQFTGMVMSEQQRRAQEKKGRKK